ncbi:TagK domain-containing protein [Paraburkholderia sp. BR10954]|uniref:TagK domain-containing protein n=1 Tax=Paraburkholderia sp. BR10954 TaxID=3236995 RepID=UPI0034D25711
MYLGRRPYSARGARSSIHICQAPTAFLVGDPFISASGESFTNARFTDRSDSPLHTGQAMTGYHARWDHSPFEAGALRTFARTIQSLGLVRTASRNGHAGVACSSDAAPSAHPDLQLMPDLLLNPPLENTNAPEESVPTPPSSVNPRADRIEPVLTKPDDFSDLIALADEDDDDPLQLRREPHAAERGGHDGMAKLLAADIDDADPLAALTLEYRDALLNRKSENGPEPKASAEARSESIIGSPPDPFAELVDPSRTEASVFDLLTQGKNIDTLLDGLDSFGAEQIFEADQTREILALLAPRGIPAHRAGRTALLAREEHHLVSMDSHIAMPESIEYEEPAFSDEHNR